MKKYLQYAWYVIRHKWYVFAVCHRHGILWLGLIHDWSKLRPSEFFPYARYFYGKSKKNCYDCTHIIWSQCDFNGSGIGDGEQASSCKDYSTHSFDFAWLLHQKHNKHHWQWWILPEDDGGLKILRMSEKYVVEMYCDWVGASLAQGHGGASGVVTWYEVNKHKMQLETRTCERIEQLVYAAEAL